LFHLKTDKTQYEYKYIRKLLQESNLTVRQPMQGVHHVLQSTSNVTKAVA